MDIYKTAATVVCVFSLGCGVNSYNPPPNPNFVVWDATLYQGKPDLQQFGMRPLTGLYSSSLWSGTDWTNPPSPQNVNGLLQASPGTAFLDIENWSTDAPANVQKYLQTIQSFEQFAPTLKFGYYGVSPIRDYWDALDGPGSSQYQAWQARNDAVAPIAAQANVLFPSIYTFYPDENGWQTYAIAQIKEARRIGPGKPVYVFLWPQFEDPTEGYLPSDMWRMELETARQYADGAVIWGGSQQTWDNNAPWWLETQSFLEEIKEKK
jgi:hypothetical protein